MAPRFHNTLTDRVEPFEPLQPGHARIYACGPTVYDYSHIGHMRSALVYDVLVRHLRESGMQVTYVRNITDIEDKIIARSAERGIPPLELAAGFETAYNEDTQRMWMIEPDVAPRVSDHLEEINRLIQQLIDNGSAYESDGDVYFEVEKFEDYGKLSHRKQSDLEYGASGRTHDEEERRKRHPADFALWKKAKPGEACWPSPWGDGRPGWHIECSAMSMRYLGERFDLHGGGLDLVFPHHENEIAQSQGATGVEPVKLWVHHGFIEVNKEKMSKSLGNFFTARQAFKLVEPEGVRYYAMSVHYRAPMNLDWETDADGNLLGFPQIEEAERRVEYLYNTRTRLKGLDPGRIVDVGPVPEALSAFRTKLSDALDDDLNMPVALAATADFLKQVNELVDAASRKRGQAPRAALESAEEGFAVLGRVLGLGNDDAAAFLGRVRRRRVEARGMTEADVEAKIQARIDARAAKDYARADRIRDELTEFGVELMDSPEGTTWRLP